MNLQTSLAMTTLFSLVSPLLAAQSIGPRFEVASVKRSSPQQTVPPTVRPGGGFTATEVTLGVLIEYAYDLQPIQVLGGPDWMRSSTTRFAVNARASGEVSGNEVKAMVRTLLEDRFKLVVRSERREMALQDLVLNRSDGRLGDRLVSVSSAADCPAARAKLPVQRFGGPVAFLYQCGPITDVARMISSTNKVIVIDRTGLSGVWMAFAYFSPAAINPARAADADLPSLSTALQEQLGLLVNSTRGLADVLVVESVQLPTED